MDEMSKETKISKLLRESKERTQRIPAMYSMPKKLLTHKQVRVVCPTFGPIDVDAEMAPMLKRLWALGMITCSSCQEDRRGAYVVFHEPKDATLIKRRLEKAGIPVEMSVNSSTGTGALYFRTIICNKPLMQWVVSSGTISANTSQQLVTIYVFRQATDYAQPCGVVQCE